MEDGEGQRSDGGDWRVFRDKAWWYKNRLYNDTNKLYLFKIIIVYDNNINIISLQWKEKKET